MERARSLGATEAVQAGEHAVAELLELTGGQGADVSFEVVGATAPIQTAVNCLKKGGRGVLVGNISPSVDLPLQPVVTRELSLLGSCASAGEYPQCMELMASGAIDVVPLLSAVAPLEEGASWFDRLYNHEPGLMKVLLKP